MPSSPAMLLHVCIAVRDLDAALLFYRDVLGFESVFDTENGSADGVLLGFDRDVVSIRAQHLKTPAAGQRSTEINLVEFLDPRTIGRKDADRAMNDEGLTRLALQVDNLDEAYRRIASHDGVQVICPPREILIHTSQTVESSRWFSFRDPCGVFITAVEADRTMEG